MNYFKLELNIYPYFYTTVTNAVRVQYSKEFVVGDYYGKLGQKGVLYIPEFSFRRSNHFLNLLINKNKSFEDHLLTLSNKVIKVSESLQTRSYEDHKNDHVSNLDDFYFEYDHIYSEAIAFGYVLDHALDLYIKNNPDVVKDFNSSHSSFLSIEEFELSEIFKKTSASNKDLQEKIKEHIYKYNWIRNDYTGEYIIDIEYLLSRKNEIINKSYEINIPKTIKKPESITEWVQLLIYIRDIRKKINLIATGLLDRYLKRICNQYNLIYEQASFLTVEELEFLKDKKIPNYNGERFLHITKDGLVDLSKEKWEAMEFNKLSEKPGNEIKGMVAYNNGVKIKGRVKIILSRSDFKKFQKGNIVVTSMTRPEFIAIIKDCLAIIADEGGITCHAAIISRELKIPCIIGTKIATKILKDGDLVEVDADKGVVRILENN